jgi:hypothetical protein
LNFTLIYNHLKALYNKLAAHVAQAAPSIPQIGINVYNKIKSIIATETKAIEPAVNFSEVKMMEEFEPVIKLNKAERLKIEITGSP